MPYSELPLSSEIRDQIRKHENEVETVHFRPINWEDSRGVLIGRYEKSLGSQAGQYGVAEYVDVFLDKVKWVEVGYTKNRGTNQSEYKVMISKDTTHTDSSETTTGMQFGFEKIAKIGLSVENKRISVNSTTTSAGSEQTHRLNPNDELFVYRCDYYFNLQAWWVVDTEGKERIVAQTATNETHRASVSRVIQGDDAIFFKRMSGEKTIKLSPSPEKSESSWEQIHYGDVYAPAKRLVDAAWHRALHPDANREKAINSLNGLPVAALAVDSATRAYEVPPL